MAGEVAPARKKRAAVARITEEIYSDTDISEAPENIQDFADAMLGTITCCSAAVVDVRNFEGFGDDQYWQLNIAHEMLIYKDGRPHPHGRVTTVRISDRG